MGCLPKKVLTFLRGRVRGTDVFLRREGAPLGRGHQLGARGVAEITAEALQARSCHGFG